MLCKQSTPRELSGISTPGIAAMCISHGVCQMLCRTRFTQGGTAKDHRRLGGVPFFQVADRITALVRVLNDLRHQKRKRCQVQLQNQKARTAQHWIINGTRGQQHRPRGKCPNTSSARCSNQPSEVRTACTPCVYARPPSTCVAIGAAVRSCTTSGMRRVSDRSSSAGSTMIGSFARCWCCRSLNCDHFYFL